MNICPNCQAIGSCCEASKDRLETANALRVVLERQSKTIAAMRLELDALRAKVAPR